MSVQCACASKKPTNFYAWGYECGEVAHRIVVSAQVLLVLTLGLWTLDFGLGLDNLLF